MRHPEAAPLCTSRGVPEDDRGIDLVHVPYKAERPRSRNVIAGHVPILIGRALRVNPLIKSGKIKVLAFFPPSARPSAEYPTVAEAVPGVARLVSWGSSLRRQRRAGW